MDEGPTYRIAAVDRALLVMEALAERPGEGVSELARRLGMTKTIVFRLLRTLESRGFAACDPDHATWSLGYRVAVLGERVGPTQGLYQAARPVMEALRDATSETINLVVRDGLQSLVVATREGRHPMRLFAQAGRHGPLHAGGGSTLLLAFAPADVQDAVLAGPLERFTPATVVDPAVLRRTLARARRAGWHIALSDLDDGAFSIAAPIRGAGEEAVAALSIAGAIARLDDDRRTRHLAAVQAAAARVSAKLAGRPGTAPHGRAA
jgi:IclR family KDG regulon transcriptional repressor